MTENKTILVVDDEAKILDVVKSYLEKAGYKAVCAASGGDALRYYEKLAPALIILDLMLPDISGEDICREVRRRSRTPIIMLTAKIEDADVIKGLGLGADDYLTKPFSPGQLVARVEAVLRRSSGEDAPLKSVLEFCGGALVIDHRQREVKKDGGAVALTPNEFNILYTMAKHPLRAYTREELIERALGDDFDGYDRVIDTHIKNLRQKIEDNPRAPKYILTVHGTGYKFGVK
jgi:DNA-binding response OmpR family regulator